MLRILIVLLVAGCINGLPKGLFKGFEGRVVGGSKAELAQFPYQAELFLPTGHQCGGAILNKRWVLTAAHCFLGVSTMNINLKVGTITLDNGGDIYRLDQIIPHAEYNPKDKQNDLALVSTRKDIVFNKNVQPIALGDYELPEGTKVVAIGWGFTTWAPDSKISNDLYYVNLKIMSNTDCGLRMIWWNVVTDDQICTYTRRGEGICSGDSGGPLVHDGHLVGVVSWGVPCGGGYPDVYAKTSAYLGWIKENMIDKD